MREVRGGDGIHLPDCRVWFDSLRAKTFGVVSHAHSDHAAWHDVTVLTPPTAALMRARRGSSAKTVRETPFFSPYEHSSARITLIPAGHVLGSAQVFLESDSGTVLYSGDFKLRPSLTAEQATTVQADTLVMECTFGRPHYRFPATEEIRCDIIAFCQNAVTAGEIPILLAYSIGKSQELLALLAGAGLRIVIHPTIYKMARIYEQFGVSFPLLEEFDGNNYEGSVIICPPNTRDQLAHIPRAKFAVASGWALDKSAIFRYRCDAAFPLSDHADYEELIAYVGKVSPKRVYTVHGFVEDFARDLRRLGIEALALGGQNQLELRL